MADATEYSAGQAKDLKEVGAKWIERIRKAGVREETFLKDAENAEKVYSADGEGGEVSDFNILYSNVETIVPSIYNSTPAPDIRQRWPTPKAEGLGDQPQVDDPEKDVANMLERAVIVQVDDNAMDTEVEAAAQDAFLAGRGIVRVRLESDVREFTVIETEEIDGDVVEVENTYTETANERVVYEVVSWRDYREGPATRFEHLPWVAFRHTVEFDDKDRFDAAMISAQESLESKPPTDDSPDTIEVWEVWCREKKEVLFIRASDGVVLQQTEDPLGLSGFFPIPRPIQPIGLSGKREPVNPYKMYRKQADELNRLTRRIRAIVEGLKLRGAIVGDAENIAKVSEAADNQLVPIANVEGLAQTGGLDKAVIWWPVDKAIQVLSQLYVARDQTKALIYEITGISDIVRGASNTAETATAQQIKTQWGSLRVRKMQRLIERHCRDLFVLTSEIIAVNFSPERMSEITKMEVTQPMMSIMQGGVQQYRIDVESDSTVRADLTRMKGEMGEFLNGTAQFFATMSPVVSQAPQIAGAVVDLYAAFARQFNLGKQAEDAVDQMGKVASAQSQNRGPSPEQQQAQQEAMQKAQMEMAKLRLEAQKLQADVEAKRADIAQAEQFKAIDLEIKRAELAIKEADLQLKAVNNAAELELEREQKRAVKVGE